MNMYKMSVCSIPYNFFSFLQNITIHWWHFVGVVISKIWGFMKNVFTRKSSDDVVNEDLEDFFGK